MKYIPADKLIAEVERLKPRLRKIGGKDVLVTTDSVYKKLNRIIDFARSLQKEQPEVDLEKAVKDYIKDNFTLTPEVLEIPEEERRYSMWEDDMRAFAKHFYELGLNARKE